MIRAFWQVYSAHLLIATDLQRSFGLIPPPTPSIFGITPSSSFPRKRTAVPGKIMGLFMRTAPSAIALFYLVLSPSFVAGFIG